jgi:hypothetical protein
MRVVSHSARPHVSDEDGLLADLDGVVGRLIAGVRDVNRHPQPVHAAHHLAAKLGQPAVARLAQPGAQAVRLRLGDAHAADAESVEDVDAVERVLDRRSSLE